MNASFTGIVLCMFVAFALRLFGPVDGDLAVLVVGGAVCNHSDLVTWDCVEINGKDPDKDPCQNFQIGADAKQTCLDIEVKSQTICTENNCQNVTKDKQTGASCTKVNCGS